jgi:hypothetical protein
MANQKEPRIFLCHASDDKERVRELYRQLKEAGFRPWLDEEDLLPGQKWVKPAIFQRRVAEVSISTQSRKDAETQRFFISLRPHKRNSASLRLCVKIHR